MKLLIIEDEKALSESIASYLNDYHYSCEMAYDFPSAREKIQLHDYNCIILDIALPHGNGLTLLRELKAAGKTDGVLIVSARNSLDDKIEGLNRGADDYLTKPFHLSELGARVSAIIRRKTFGGHNVLKLDGLTIDLEERTVRGDNGHIDLTRKEYELLLYFTGNRNKVLTKEAIAEHLWGDQADMTDNYDFLYTHIKNLRRKLLQGGCPDYIKAVYGMGYKFNPGKSVAE
ncbi:response regulator transcription factor [Dinghuibacter silviterrae]|uniref:DNA-binding response OmpR family regulator n=1 Tax=Dinghuibacter silviterrae TaxID=1539049 RepID=A0A4V3GLG2_9BACT|nr:response regulator transcription factor [Dinghuibacter silviterrae]TDW99422.1 DNA-binding response OmpR family regulator [Dinghuibacter silviterrae]